MTDMPSEAELQAREERVRANAEASPDWSAADMPGWADLTPEQQGWIADIEVDAYWRGYNAPAPSPASPEGPPHGGRICQCWCGPCCAGDHANCPADPAPRSPEGPHERLRERIAHAIRENTHIEDWYDALRCADAVLPLLTAERERAALADRILAARLDLSHRPPQWRDEDKGYNAGLEHAARLARNEEATAERERDEARERADKAEAVALSDDDERDVQTALRCVDADNASHWPTVAGVLAAEVRRLRPLLTAERERGASPPVLPPRGTTVTERPEGPHEGLRDRIAHVIREECPYIEDWYDALRCADAVLPLLTAERERLSTMVSAALEAAFSGDDYEENAEAAASEAEWSWWKWLATSTVSAALSRTATEGDQ